MSWLTGERKRQVWERDRWRCRMPCCLNPDGRAIDPALAGENREWAPTVDHIIRRADGGTHALANLRAAHWLCNQAAAGASVLRATAIGARIGIDAAKALLAMKDMLR